MYKTLLSGYDELEIVVAEESVQKYLIAQSGAIALNIFIFSAIVGVVVWFLAYRVVVRPMRGLRTRSGVSPKRPKRRSPKCCLLTCRLDTVMRSVAW